MHGPKVGQSGPFVGLLGRGGRVNVPIVGHSRTLWDIWGWFGIRGSPQRRGGGRNEARGNLGKSGARVFNERERENVPPYNWRRCAVDTRRAQQKFSG